MAGAVDLQLMQAMLPYAQPTSYPAIRRSQYLADALQSLQENGADNLRTPTALWGKLAGQALLQTARDRNFQDLSKSLGGDMGAYADALTKNIPGFGPAAAPAAQMGEALATAPQEPTPAQMTERDPGRQYLYQPGPIQDQASALPTAPPQTAQATPQPAPQPAPGAVPTQVILPQEIEIARSYLRSNQPQLRALGIEMVKEMQARARTPIDPSKPAFVPDGRGGYTVRDLGKEVTSTPGPKPGQTIQTTNATGAIDVKDTGVIGATPPGQQYDLATGGFQQLPTTVGGRTMPFGALSPTEVESKVKKISEGKQVINYTTLRAKAASALQPEGPENNATDLNLIDVANTALANNPDLAVSEGFFKTVQEAQGWLSKTAADLKNNIRGSGLLQQTYRDRLKRIIAASLHHRYDAAKQEIDTFRPGLEIIGLGDQADAVLGTLQPPIEYHPAPARPPAGVQQPAPPRPANVPPDARWDAQKQEWYR